MKKIIVKLLIANALLMFGLGAAHAATPSNISPSAGQTNVSTTPILEINCLTDNLSGQYQISENTLFSPLIYDSGELSHDICTHLAKANLSKGTSYFWRARTSDNNSVLSAWSSPVSFTTISASVKTGLIEFQDGVGGYSGTADADVRGSHANPSVAIREWNQGAQNILRMGRRPAGSLTDEIYRSLINFDISSISTGSTIISAYLEMSDGPPHSDSTVFRQPFEAYEILRPWGEGVQLKGFAPTAGEVSWTYNAFSNTWNAPGLAGPGDRSVLPIYGGAVTNQSGSKYIGSSGAFIQIVQNWISNPAQNFGVFLQATNENRRNTANIGSSESLDRAIRPRLVVEAIVTTAADISIVSGASNTSPASNDTISLTVSVTNSGSDNASGLSISSEIPNGFTLLTNGSSAGSYNPSNGLWTVTSLPSGATETLTLNGTVNTTTQFTHFSELIAVDQLDPDSYPDNGRAEEDDQSSITIFVNPALSFGASSLTFKVIPGASDSQSLSLTTTNGSSVSYSLSDDATWLTLVPGSGNTPDNISVNVDTSGLAEGSYTATITATSAGINDSTVTVNLLVGYSLLNETFDVDAGVFSYTDDAFYTTSEPSYASGNYTSNGGISGGAIRIVLGGVNTNLVTDMSAGWSTTINLASATSVTFAFNYRLIMTTNYEADECSQALFSIDGVLYNTSGANSYLQQICGADSVLDSGWTAAVVNNVSLAAGTHTLTFGGYNNKKTRTNESTQVLFDGIDIFSGAASLVFSSNNLSYGLAPGASATQSLNLTASDGAAVSYSISDDAAWLSLSPSTGVTPGGVNATADATGLANGTYTATITATAAGYADTSSSISLVVSQAALNFDASNVDFALAANSSATQSIAISSSDASAVSYNVSDNATWLSLLPASGSTTDNISMTANSSGLADGSYTATITATAAGYTSATATVNLTVGSSLLEENFNVSSGGFVYADDTFYATAQPSYASGNYDASGGSIRVLLGGLDRNLVTNISGGWASSFNLSAATTVDVSFRYRMALTTNYESDECSQVLFSIDSILYNAAGANTFLEQICGTDTVLDTGWKTVTINVSLLAGSHTLTLGGYNNQKTRPNETTQFFFDDVLMVNGAPALPTLQLNPSSFGFNLIPGASASQAIAISLTDASAVSYTVNDNAAWLSLIPGTGVTSDNITVTADATGLADGTYTATITASATGYSDVTSSVSLTVSQPALVLGTGSLSYTLASGGSNAQGITVDTNDASSVSYTVNSNAPWLTLMTGTGLTADMLTVTADATGLADGSYSATVTVVSAGYTDATATVSLTVSSSLFAEDFATSAGSFSYADDVFYGTSEAAYAKGNYAAADGVSDGAVRVLLGGIDASLISGMSGGWTSSLTLASSSTVAVTLSYRIALTANYEPDECSQALFSVDGVLYDTSGGNSFLQQICGGDAVLDSGWKTVTVNVGLLAGTHSITVGGYNNQKTRANESTEIFFDNISMTTGSPSIIFDASSLNYDMLPGSSMTQTLNLSAIDSASVAYSASDNASWLTLSPTTGTTPDSLSVTVDSTGLANGTYSATITATASGYGDAMTNVSLTVSNSIFTQSFDTNAGNFTYADDTFLGTSQPNYASGSYEPVGGLVGGGVRIKLGGIDNNNVLGMSGGWSRTFNLAAATTISVSLASRVSITGSYEPDECVQALVTVDGTMYDGSGANSFLQQICGLDPALDSGWQTASFSLSLAAGAHTITVGGYNNQKTKSNESAKVYFDEITVSPL